MSKDINRMVLDLLDRSEKTVYKLFISVHPENQKPTLEELNKFKKSLMHSVKRNKEEALKLFPIIQYLNAKSADDEQFRYDDELFSVGLDEKIAVASPIEVLDSIPKEDEYNMKFAWDFTDIDERESAIYQAAYNYFQMIKDDQNIKDFLKKIGLFTEEYIDLVTKENEFFKENIPQEVFALHQTDDLNYLLPIELAQLDDPDLEIIFYKSFIEKKLLSYQLWGIEREITEDYDVFKKQKEDFGDLIICLDTSGSMRGMNEVLSKGIAMALIHILDEMNIPVVFCTFSMKQHLMDLRVGYEHKKSKIVNKQLKKSYYGGTDFDGLIEMLATKLLKNTLKRSNVLIISDYTFKNLSANSRQAIEQVSKAKNISFHALQISDNPVKNHIFSSFHTTWSYSFVWMGVPYSKDEMITELANMPPSLHDLGSIHAFGLLKMMSGKRNLESRTESNANLVEKIKDNIDEYNAIKQNPILGENQI